MVLLENSILRDHDVVAEDDVGFFADDEADEFGCFPEDKADDEASSNEDNFDNDVRDPDGPTYVDEDVDASLADVADDIDNSASASLSDGSVPMIDEASLEAVLGGNLDEYIMTEDENLIVRSVVLYDRLPLPRDRDDDGVVDDENVTKTVTASSHTFCE